MSRLDEEQSRQHAPKPTKKPHEGNEAERAIRRSLTPLDEGLLPLIREIAAAGEAIRARELAHYGRYRDLLEGEAKLADDFLRGNGLMPSMYALIKEALDQAKATDRGDDVARLAAQGMSGDAAALVTAGTAEALRNPVVIDRLAQLNASNRLRQVLAGLADSTGTVE